MIKLKSHVNVAKFDVDAANYTLLAYAAHGKKLGDRAQLEKFFPGAD